MKLKILLMSFVSVAAVAMNGQVAILAASDLREVVESSTGALLKAKTFLENGETKKLTTVIANVVYVGEGQQGSLLLTGLEPLLNEKGQIDFNPLSLVFGTAVTSFREGKGSPRTSYQLNVYDTHLLPLAKETAPSPNLKGPSQLVLIELNYSLPDERKPARLKNSQSLYISRAPMLTFGYGQAEDEALNPSAQSSDYQRARTSGFLTFSKLQPLHGFTELFMKFGLPSNQLISNNAQIPLANQKNESVAGDANNDGYTEGPCSNDVAAPLFVQEHKLVPPSQDDVAQIWKPVTEISLVGVHFQSEGTCARVSDGREVKSYYINLNHPRSEAVAQLENEGDALNRW